MNVLIDTNVALDYILKRKGVDKAKIIFLMAEQESFSCYISASAITDIFYIAKKKISKKSTRDALKKLLPVFKPATVTDSHIYQALALDWEDFEDSVQFVVGESIAADYIVTRNTKDYSASSIPVVTPEDFITAITTDETE